LRGKFYAEIRDLDMAISDFEKAIRIDPKDEESCRLLIRSSFDAGKFNDVIESENISVHHVDMDI